MAERRPLPITMTVGEFEVMSSLSHSSIYKLIRQGEIEAVKICGRRMVVVDSYLALIERAKAGVQRGGQRGGNDNEP